MIWLSNSTLARLRDQLQDRGARPSLAFEPGTGPDGIEWAAASAEYGPLCEAMYMMMAADGQVTSDERNVLKGALRNLSGETIRSAHIEAMLDAAAQSVATHGRAQRMNEITAALRDDPGRAEVAFVLAAAIAFADNAIADEENDTLNSFAEGLGIDDSRANELLDSVEADLATHER